MTTLTLPNEIINKIFSYIEGNNNQIIKNGLTNTNWTNRNELFFEIKFEFDIIKHNLIRDKLLYNHKIIKYEKYFKYSELHRERKYIFDFIKYRLTGIIQECTCYDDRINYHVLQDLREKYIYDYNYYFRNLKKKHYNTYFRYTILHENRKKVCNDIKRYNTNIRVHEICNKKLSNNILLERGILINYNEKNNNKRQKKWN